MQSVSRRNFIHNFAAATTSLLYGDCLSNIAISTHEHERFIDLLPECVYECVQHDGRIPDYKISGIQIIRAVCGIPCPHTPEAICPPDRYLELYQYLKAYDMFEKTKRLPHNDIVLTKTWTDELLKRHKNVDIKQSYERYYAKYREYLTLTGLYSNTEINQHIIEQRNFDERDFLTRQQYMERYVHT